MTLKQKIEQVLKENSEVCSQFFYSEVSKEERGYDEDCVTQFRNLLNEAKITLEFVDNFGGEGMGDDYWSVYSFTDGTDKVHVQFDGWYASYHGADYNEWFFVELKEVMRVEFSRT